MSEGPFSHDVAHLVIAVAARTKPYKQTQIFMGEVTQIHSVSKSFVVCLSMKRPSDISICSECSGETTHQNSVFRSFSVCLVIDLASNIVGK